MGLLAPRLYHQAIWDMMISYRIFLISVRMLELLFICLRFLSFRAPLLIVWTRLPFLKDHKAPYGELAEVLGPFRSRPGLVVGQPVLGHKTLGDIGTIEELAHLQQQVMSRMQEPPPRMRTIVGGVIRGLVIELGSAWLKFAQLASMRPELPPFLREELSAVQDRLPSIGEKETIRALERELGQPIENVFEWIDLNPIACASLAQVNRAKLLTGEEVALKIQRPLIQGITLLDGIIITKVLMGLVRLVMPVTRRMPAGPIMDVFYRRQLEDEIDFFLEGRSQDKFRHLVENHPQYSKTIKVAKVYWEYTTSKLLIMELIKDYWRLDRIMEIPTDQLWDLCQMKVPRYPKEVPLHWFHILCELWVDMVQTWAYIHGDPHLGNVYLLEPQDGHDWRIFICDFGMMNEVSNTGWIFQTEWIHSLFYYRDPVKLAQVFTPYLYTGDMSIEEIIEQQETQRKSYVKFLKRRAVELEPGKEAEVKLAHRGTFGFSTEVFHSMLPVMSGGFSLSKPVAESMISLLLLCKSQGYLEEMGLCLWGDLDRSIIDIPVIKERLKRDALEQLKDKDMTNLRDFLDQLSEPLKQPEVAKFLTQTTEPTKYLR